MMLDLLKSQFDKVLEREGKTVKLYNSDLEFTVFFRKAKNRKTEQLNDITIFYAVDTPFNVGTQLVFNDKVYLVLSKFAAENEVYQYSKCRECNKLVTASRLVDGVEDEFGNLIPKEKIYAQDVPVYKSVDISKFNQTNDGLVDVVSTYFALPTSYKMGSEQFFISKLDRIKQVENGIVQSFQVDNIDDENSQGGTGFYTVLCSADLR